MQQLHGYLDVPEEAVKDLRVFDIDDLIEFLENTVDTFAKEYLI